MKLYIALLLFCALICFARAEVFEAGSSEDVDTFVSFEPDKNRALLFYDEVQDVANKDIHSKVDLITSIFFKTDDQYRLHEDWVDKLNGGVNMMRIDAFKTENDNVVKSFNVKSTPYLVIFENKNTQLETVIDDSTFDQVKEIFSKQDEAKADSSSSNEAQQTMTTDQAKAEDSTNSKSSSETQIPDSNKNTSSENNSSEINSFEDLNYEKESTNVPNSDASVTDNEDSEQGSEQGSHETSPTNTSPENTGNSKESSDSPDKPNDYQDYNYTIKYYRFISINSSING